MDRRERRRRKRLAAKIEQGVILKKSPQPHTESPPPQSWVRQYFGKTISRTKLLYGLLGAVATFLSIPSLEPAGSSTVDCPPLIGGIGTYSGQVDFAELEIVVSYKQSWWPRAVAARYPFRAMRDVSKAVHWTHITPAEEKSIIQK